MDPAVLWNDTLVYGFDDTVGLGGCVGVAAAGEVVYPLWIDTRAEGNQEEVHGRGSRRLWRAASPAHAR